jgi:hypothetical protein
MPTPDIFQLSKKLRSKILLFTYGELRPHFYNQQTALALLAATAPKYAALAAKQYMSSRAAGFAHLERCAQQQSICVQNPTLIASVTGKYTTKENTQSHIEVTQPVDFQQMTNTPTTCRVLVAHSAAKKAHCKHTN